MAQAASLAQLQAEASCPICLDYLRDPVTTDCGHNFCHSCLLQRWEGLQGDFPCPVCLQHCPDRSLRRNTQLCHMVDVVKQLPNTRRKRKRQEEKPLCEKHHQVLSLFCEEDLELLCPQCKISSHHGGHLVVPMEPAAACHRKKLKGSIEFLTKHLEEADKALEIQTSKAYHLMEEVANQRSKLQVEVEHMKHFLGKMHDDIHFRLLKEEKGVQDEIIEKNNQISGHISMLKTLLDDINDKRVQPDTNLLMGIEKVHSTFENLESPAGFSYELNKEILTLPPQYFGLHKMISKFQEYLTLDAKTAHGSLILSQDGKTATFQRRKQNRAHQSKAFTSHPAVLGSEGFDAGRHFWQVKGRGLGELSLGVCKESFPRNVPIPPTPDNGCWKIQVWATTPDTGASGNSCHIGVFLDYELGEVSFYNLFDRSNLYTFSAIFTGKLMPYFSVCPFATSLKLRLVEDEV
ncbi:tripartite motif-containing protein 60-like [Phacochoerus africanus]|uniref:tripartite motif-containing protein 60-like n=1 Tax=Phacochoerus africanus TaxID=41426 RepID=UPI001FDA7EDF|nr:tripartite motif-containing protein 60-like [Phacochoerus africanus]